MEIKKYAVKYTEDYEPQVEYQLSIPRGKGLSCEDISRFFKEWLQSLNLERYYDDFSRIRHFHTGSVTIKPTNGCVKYVLTKNHNNEERNYHLVMYLQVGEWKLVKLTNDI